MGTQRKRENSRILKVYNGEVLRNKSLGVVFVLIGERI